MIVRQPSFCRLINIEFGSVPKYPLGFHCGVVVELATNLIRHKTGTGLGAIRPAQGLLRRRSLLRILANPPFNISDRGGERLRGDKRRQPEGAWVWRVS